MFELLFLAGAVALLGLVFDTGDDGDGDEATTPDDQRIEGTEGPDQLLGFGSDTVLGNGGDDSIGLQDDAVARGGPGNDVMTGLDDARLSGDLGDDMIELYDSASGHGGGGSDLFQVFDRAQGMGENGPDLMFAYGEARIWGGSGADSLGAHDSAEAFGESGADELYAEADATVHGGAGDDLLWLFDRGEGDGGTGDDTLWVYDEGLGDGGAGDDTLWAAGQEGAGTILGGAGDDYLLAQDGSEAFGGTGDDTVVAQNGASAYGGDGNDLGEVVFDQSGSPDLGPGFVSGGAGDDTVGVYSGGEAQGENGDDLLYARRENLLDASEAGHPQDIMLSGGEGEDDFIVAGFADSARFGSDLIMEGGDGADTYVLTDGVFGTLNGYNFDGTDWVRNDVADRLSQDADIGTITDFDPAEDVLVVEQSDLALVPYAVTGMETVASGSGVDLILTAEHVDDDTAPVLTRTLHIAGIDALDLDRIEIVKDLAQFDLIYAAA